MNINDEIKALKERIAALEYHAKEEQEFPQDGDDYWYVDADADVMDIEWDGSDCDQVRMSIGNVFKTKEQAEFAVEKLRVEAELRKFSKPFEHGKPNFNLIFNKDNGLIIDAWNIYWCQGTIHFESKSKAQQAIQSIGEERIKKYIFELED